MQIIALARGPVDVELLASVADRPPDQVLDDVEAALVAGLVVERADGTGLTPGHDLARQALLVDLSAARQVRLHARLAAALQARGRLGPEKVLEVAHHLAAAAARGGRRAGVRGWTSFALGDLDTARRSLERALHLARTGATHAAMRGDPDAALSRAVRMIALAERLEYSVFVLLGRIVEAWAAAVPAERPDPTGLRSALAAYRSTGLTIYAPTCSLLLAEIHQRAGDDDAARSAVEAARELTRRTGEVPHGSRLDAMARRWAQPEA